MSVEIPNLFIFIPFLNGVANSLLIFSVGAGRAGGCNEL